MHNDININLNCQYEIDIDIDMEAEIDKFKQTQKNRDDMESLETSSFSRYSTICPSDIVELETSTCHKPTTLRDICNQVIDSNISQNLDQIHNLSYNPPTGQPPNPKETGKKNNLRIVASLTCSYQGLSYIKQTLHSLHDQEFDCIYLNVPGTFFSHSRDLIPEWMKICCEVIFCQDIGPILKLLPILDREKDPNTIIVTVENGIIYPKNMSKVFLQLFRRNQQSIYAVQVYKFKSINYFQPITINNGLGDLFDGTYGVGYLRGYFRDDLNTYISLLNKYQPCIYSDYLVITNYLQKYKISIRCLNRKLFNISHMQTRCKKDTLYTSSGLNFKMVFTYYQVIQLLANNNMIYFKNPSNLLQILHYLSSRPYNIAFK